MPNAAIELQAVDKSYGPRRILKDLQLVVPERSVFAFLGNNGHGKSTTIRLLAGLAAPDRGSIRVLGQDIRQHRREVLAQMGCLIEAPSSYPNLTAREFLSIGACLKQLPRSEIDRALELVGLRPDRRQRIEHYSLGMRQRLALAHALLGRPRLLVLDEPTNGLDPDGIRDIRALLSGLPEPPVAPSSSPATTWTRWRRPPPTWPCCTKARSGCRPRPANWNASSPGSWPWTWTTPNAARARCRRWATPPAPKAPTGCWWPTSTATAPACSPRSWCRPGSCSTRRCCASRRWSSGSCR